MHPLTLLDRLPFGAALSIQVSVALSIGLLTAWLMRRRDPVSRSLFYRISYYGALLAAAVGLGLLLFPAHARPGRTNRPTQPDRQSAQSIIHQAILAEARVKTLTGRITIDSTGGIDQPAGKKMPEETAVVELEKLDIGRIVMSGWFRSVDVSDGKMQSAWMDWEHHQIRYNTNPVRKAFFTLGGMDLPPVEAFYGDDPRALRNYLSRPDLHAAGTGVVDGVRCQIVESSVTSDRRTFSGTTRRPDGYYIVVHPVNPYWHSQSRLYFGPDHLLRKVTQIGVGASNTVTLHDIHLNVHLNPSDFVFHRPAGAKPFSRENMHASLVHGPAPQFNIPTPHGGAVSLASTLKGKKILLLAFIDHFKLRRQGLLQIEKDYQTLKDQGFTALVIDANDTPAELKSELAQTHLSYPIVTLQPGAPQKALLTRYGIRVFPSSYLIDGQGVAIWSDYGYLDPSGGYIKLHIDHPEWWRRAAVRR
ncbi:MAG TPA: redoxin domain-containing protein [Armatimonadota bacterium]|nr:redoxin domain-containing protein [Armatimonadota bacterium]